MLPDHRGIRIRLDFAQILLDPSTLLNFHQFVQRNDNQGVLNRKKKLMLNLDDNELSDQLTFDTLIF